MIQVSCSHLVDVERPVCANVEKTARSVIRTRTESVTVWEELDSVDIGFVASESLNGLSSTDIPKLGKSITGTRNEDVLVSRVDADRHNVTEVIRKFGDLGARLDIPEHASHIAGRGDDATIVNETAAGKIARMSRELARDTSWALSRGKVVNGANVVQTTASNIVSTGGIGAGHDP